MNQNQKEIVANWYFKSGSSEKIYEVIEWGNGKYSCNCPAWTRNVLMDGKRTCKHLREVITFNGHPPSQITPEKPIKKIQAQSWHGISKKLLDNKEAEPQPPKEDDSPYGRSFNL